MKEINKKQIINLIRENAPISRTELAKKLGVSLPTVMRAVDSLIEEKYVAEVGKGDSNGGRKPILLEIGRENHYVIGVDIARMMTVLILDISGGVVAKSRMVTKHENGPEGTVDQAVSMMETLMDRYRIPKNKIDGVGIGTPGNDFKFGDSIAESGFKGWENVDIELLMEGKLEFPVVVENNAKMLAVGELYLGQCQNVDNFISICIDYGVGSGIVLNGRLYEGENKVAGEFGHMVVDLDGIPCYCGNRGCLEMYTSIPAITRALFDRVKEGGKSVIAGPLLREGKSLDFGMIVEGMAKGDALVNETLARSGEIMGIGIANLINLYNPELVVLNGEISRSCPAFVNKAREAVKNYVFSQKAAGTKILVSELGEDAGALGAASMMMQRVFGLRYS